ncbi:peptidase M1 [Tsuneonella deserti]|uniref:Peptidase M1 n=1 Tax=Tsuneonella deserti TaxID=2035528 RepID=A0ABQ1SCR6_9SPHN|nr:M1 family metallopeptidase [Tsuneonella deserti]GGE03682.1 peptidase M1 [Tsuneonella deserti]
MRGAIRALGAAGLLLAAAPGVFAQDDPATPPPLSKRTIQSGLPLTANQQATGLDTLDLSLKVDPAAATVEGTARYGLTALGPMNRVEFDLDPRYVISSVLLNGSAVALSNWRNDDGQLSIDLPSAAAKGDKLSVAITYAGRPHIAERPPWDGGIMWKQTPTGQPWIATANQMEGCDILWPCIDSPVKRVGVTDIAFTVPAPLVAAGNGKFIGRSDENGWTTWKWRARNLNMYALTLNIGPFEKIERTYQSRFGNSIPIAFWHLPGHAKQAGALVDQIGDSIAFFERTIGPYPFGDEKVGLVETPHLGMEHQTINAYGAGFKPSPDGYDWLMEHEFAHEWFANQLAQTETNHMWLQEGLGSYMQPLYMQQARGDWLYDAMLWDSRKKIVSKVPLVPDEPLTSTYYNDREAGWGSDIYTKGAWIAHTLRGLIGDEAFFTALRRLVYGRDDPRPGNFTPQFRTTADFQREAEKASGRDLGWFFDAYLRQGPLPKLTVARQGGALDLTWSTAGGTPFPMPVEVRVGSRVVRVPMTNGRGRVQLGPDAGDYAIDPEAKILRYDPAIETWQAAEKAAAAEKSKGRTS